MATKPSTTKQSDNEEDVVSEKFDIVGHLPLEIAQKILFELSPEDLQSVTSCCLSWTAALSCEFFWKKLCERDDYLEVEEPDRSEFYTNFLKRYNYWEGVYWYNYTLQQNWETNNYKEVIYEIRDANYYKKWLFDDAFVYTTEDNKKLNVYHFDSREVNPQVFPLDGLRRHAYFVKSGKFLICYKDYNLLTVWNLETGATIHHKHNSKEFHVYKNLILLPTTSKNGKFEVFNIETEQIEYCFQFEPGQMSLNMSIMNGRIIFSTKDDVIHILKWDDKSLVTLKCCNELETEKHKLMVKNDILLSFCNRHRGNGCYDVYLCVWNITTMTKLHSTFLDYNSVDSVGLLNTRKWIYFKHYSHKDFYVYDVVFWDYMKRTEKGIFNRELVLSADVYISNDYVVILPLTHVLKMWCLSTGDLICDLNFLPSIFTYCDVRVLKTKLICAILPTVSNHLKFYVRDFEI